MKINSKKADQIFHDVGNTRFTWFKASNCMGAKSILDKNDYSDPEGNCSANDAKAFMKNIKELGPFMTQAEEIFGKGNVTITQLDMYPTGKIIRIDSLQVQCLIPELTIRNEYDTTHTIRDLVVVFKANRDENKRWVLYDMCGYRLNRSAGEVIRGYVHSHLHTGRGHNSGNGFCLGDSEMNDIMSGCDKYAEDELDFVFNYVHTFACTESIDGVPYIELQEVIDVTQTLGHLDVGHMEINNTDVIQTIESLTTKNTFPTAGNVDQNGRENLHVTIDTAFMTNIKKYAPKHLCQASLLTLDNYTDHVKRYAGYASADPFSLAYPIMFNKVLYEKQGIYLLPDEEEYVVNSQKGEGENIMTMTTANTLATRCVKTMNAIINY